MRTSLIAVPAVALITALVSPTLASADQTPTRAETEDALAQAQRAFDGKGVATGRELTPLLARLATGQSKLRGEDRREARALLARPTDGAAEPSATRYAVAEATPYCTTNFCVHYVATTSDAPSLADADSDGAPDTVEATASELEEALRIENGAGQLNWKRPPADAGRGGDNRVDVYLADLGAKKLYGYAAPEDDGDRDVDDPAYVSVPSYLSIDNDFAPAQYGNAAAIDSRRATIAHEYNHTLQFGYDFLSDLWQGESTATWAEERVFPGSNDWTHYLEKWKGCSARPGLAAPGPETGDCKGKVYGSTVFQHYLTARFGPNVVRDAYEESFDSGSFAPFSYTNTLSGEPDGFERVFINFAAATAEWKQSGFGFPDAGCTTFPDMTRVGSPLGSGATAAPVTLDHTGYALYDIDPDPGDSLVRIDVTAPAGVDSAVALVGRNGATVTTAIQRSTTGGPIDVRLDNPDDYERITAVVVNASIAINQSNPFNSATDDWRWTQDGKSYTGISVSDTAGGNAGTLTTTSSPSAARCTKATDPVADTPGALRPAIVTPAQNTPAGPATPAPAAAAPARLPAAKPLAPALTFRLSVTARQKRATVLKRGVSASLTCNQKCSASATLTLDRATAKKLKLSRTLGKASTRLSKAGKKSFRVKLSREARAALRKRGRVKATLTIRTKAASGSAKTTSRTITIVK